MGYYSCLAAECLKDKSLVYGIESNKEYCYFAEKSIKENQYKNVRILNYILSIIMMYGGIMIIVIFQPEIRRGLEQLRSK